MTDIMTAKSASRWRTPQRSTSSSRNDPAAETRMPAHSGSAPPDSSSSAMAEPMTSARRGGVGGGAGGPLLAKWGRAGSRRGGRPRFHGPAGPPAAARGRRAHPAARKRRRRSRPPRLDTLKPISQDPKPRHQTLNPAPWMSAPMIATSAITHSSSRGPRAKRVRQCSARLRRVTTPSLAACICRMNPWGTGDKDGLDDYVKDGRGRVGRGRRLGGERGAGRRAGAEGRRAAAGAAGAGAAARGPR
jgi:hypothetical protein